MPCFYGISYLYRDRLRWREKGNWRRERDSNPRRAFDPYTLSRGAPSTTRPSLRERVPAAPVRGAIILKGWCQGKERPPGGQALAGRRGFLDLRGFRALVLDAVKDLLALHRDRLGCIHAQTHLVALDAQHSHRDLITNHYGLADSTRQD